MSFHGLAVPDPLSLGALWEADLMELTVPPSRGAVIAAGERLRCQIPASQAAEAVEAFATAHAWREAHLLPLHSMRLSLHSHARATDPTAVVAGRIKRLTSIRKKLARSNINLWDIQDIAGVRAIVADMDAVRAVVRRYADGGSKHRLAKQDDHISAPKLSGYRSHHLMMRFNGDGGRELFHRRAVEIQVRTQHQHAWATALEAVGLMRREDLKAGEGNAEWLRFFQIMASEIAAAEGTPPVPSVTDDPSLRREELVELVDRIDALKTLVAYNQAINRIDVGGRSVGGRFVIRFDRNRESVTVSPFGSISAARDRLRASDEDSVVVEVDGVDSLISAYPNYFLDVRLFTQQLRLSLSRAKKDWPNLAWLRTWRWRPVL